jgi:Ser/Thr protein kinase RdoA (MazF antagonist)
MTAVRGTARPPALIERAGLEGIPIGDATQLVLLAYGETEWNRVVLLLFDSNTPAPTAAIKLARIPAFNEQIVCEHDTLRELGSNLAPPMRRSIPTSALFRWNGLAVSAETCVTGSSLSSRARPGASALEDLRLTVAWLAAFHRETTIDRVPAREWLTQSLNTIRADYAATFGLTPGESRLFATLSRRLETAGPGLLPIVWQHADFGPPNVYLDRSQVSVIDWETARRGPALADLLYFVTDWSAAIADRATASERLAHFESLFCADSRADALIRAVHGAIAEYMRRVEVPTAFLAFLLVYTFLEKALERAQRLAKLGRPHAADRASNRFIAYVEVLAQHAHRVFGEACS